MKMKLNIDSDMLMTLITLGLENEESPVQFARGYGAANVRIKSDGGASFDLINVDDDDQEEVE